MVDPTKSAEDTAANNIYAAAPQASDGGWGMLYAAPQYRKRVIDEDGNETDDWVDELQTIIDYLYVDFSKPGSKMPVKGTGSPTGPTGVWMGGTKYSATRCDHSLVVGEYTIRQMICTARPNKEWGEPQARVATVVSLDKDFSGPTQLLIGVGFDKINSSIVTESTCQFAKYLKEQGY
jgi:hypothetical protein